MALTTDLFYAILAMDVYNRGYGAGITGLSEASNGTIKIGEATISKNILDAQILAEAQAASFYALAYDVSNVSGFSNGQNVVSYRGTDDPYGSVQNFFS